MIDTLDGFDLFDVAENTGDLTGPHVMVVMQCRDGKRLVLFKPHPAHEYRMSVEILAPGESLQGREYGNGATFYNLGSALAYLADKSRA